MAGVKKYEENFLSFTHCYQQFGIYTGALHHYPSRSQLFRAVMQTRCRSRPRDGDHRLGGSDTTTAPACAAQLPPFFMHCGLSRSSRLFKKIPGPNWAFAWHDGKVSAIFCYIAPILHRQEYIFFLLFPTDFTVVNSVYELSDTFLAILLTTVLSGNFKAPLFWQVEISIFE